MRSLFRSSALHVQPLVLTFATVLTCAAVLAFASAASASIFTQWTFETSIPATAGPFAAEVGTGSASGVHAGAAVYSSPVGNGSAHSFSSTVWAVNDYYQFTTSTTGFTDITLSWSQTSSGTGPRDFNLFYDFGGGLTQFGSTYTVLTNGTPNPAWTTGTPQPAYNFSFNLSSITGLNNAASVLFRLVDASTTSASGGTVGTGGTDRVDNFAIAGTAIAADGAVPEASTVLVWSVLCGSVLVGCKRCRQVI